MLSSQARAAMNIGLPSLSTAGTMAAPFAAVGGLAYLNRPKNVEAGSSFIICNASRLHRKIN